MKTFIGVISMIILFQIFANFFQSKQNLNMNKNEKIFKISLKHKNTKKRENFHQPSMRVFLLN
jgi:hypothetical protein